jgi:hypothetical protein
MNELNFENRAFRNLIKSLEKSLHHDNWIVTLDLPVMHTDLRVSPKQPCKMETNNDILGDDIIWRMVFLGSIFSVRSFQDIDRGLTNMFLCLKMLDKSKIYKYE